MIRYTLTCIEGHEFESWFASASTFETLQAARQVSCGVCGTVVVRKALMAPAVRSTEASEPAIAAPPSATEQALAQLRLKVESSSEYVGLRFAAEARAMHEGDVPERSIWGEAHPDEARKLIEDGVPVAALPFVPTRKTN